LNSLPTIEELDLSNNKIRKIPDLGRCRKVTEKNILSAFCFSLHTALYNSQNNILCLLKGLYINFIIISDPRTGYLKKSNFRLVWVEGSS